MARLETLVPGNCYFTVGFHDRELLFPFTAKLQHAPGEMDPKHGRSWLFEVEGAEDSTD